MASFEVKAKWMTPSKETVIRVAFSDDGGNFVTHHDFRFPPGTTKAEAIRRVRSWGADAFAVALPVQVGEGGTV